MFDFLLQDTTAGGDLIQVGNDLVHTNTYEGLIYLACFSGAEFWGNFLFKGSEKIQCQTEKAFIVNELSSLGRINIENAIRNDLAFIKKEVPGTTIDVQTKITSPDRMDIRIRVDGLVYVYEYLGDKTIYIGSETW